MQASVSKPIAGQVILYQAPEILAPIIIPLIGFLLHALSGQLQGFKVCMCRYYPAWVPLLSILLDVQDGVLVCLEPC